jgi:hypothetical protein
MKHEKTFKKNNFFLVSCRCADVNFEHRSYHCATLTARVYTVLDEFSICEAGAHL